MGLGSLTYRPTGKVLVVPYGQSRPSVSCGIEYTLVKRTVVNKARSANDVTPFLHYFVSLTKTKF